ncbi:hypothetical protein CEXT_637021 [Caerostris extrusa]|uniref:Uncharacterized protein n=1 Tax=Caerostris extrusa TaxID=172846 RepID=A0AAV4T959_CAEEX|nr:hypothetical protein CEXT_637021 [Caerostris extrusa]
MSDETARREIWICVNILAPKCDEIILEAMAEVLMFWLKLILIICSSCTLKNSNNSATQFVIMREDTSDRIARIIALYSCPHDEDESLESGV